MPHQSSKREPLMEVLIEATVRPRLWEYGPPPGGHIQRAKFCDIDCFVCFFQIAKVVNSNALWRSAGLQRHGLRQHERP